MRKTTEYKAESRLTVDIEGKTDAGIRDIH